MSKTTFTVFRGSESSAIKSAQTTRILQPHDVLIEIKYAGLCGTDRHFRPKDIALGHEGAGVVKQIGKDVKMVKVGDRVGLGYIKRVCGICTPCLTGKDQYCENKGDYGSSDFDVGTFANELVWDESTVIKVPDDLELDIAAPLMCGGATVWNALTTYPLHAGDRVGVQGIGGLGHMAIQFASKMGCDVVVFSHSDSKKEEALKLGAKEFHVTKNDAPQGEIKKLNRLLCTGSSHPHFENLIPLMAPGGSIYPLSVSFEPSSVPIQLLINAGIRLQGSAVASRPSIRRMLEFVVLHKIRPVIMTFPLNKGGIEKAFDALENGKMRYRGVLVADGASK